MSTLFSEPTNAPKLEDFLGEDKKYKTPDDVAKAIVEKDNFIERLKAENAQFRATPPTPVVDRSQEILDQLDALRNLRTQPATPQSEPTEPARAEVKGLSEDDVLRLLNERDQKRQVQSNIEAVKVELNQKFGPQYGQVLKSLAEKMGVGTTFLESIAAQSPAALMKLLDGVSAPTEPFVAAPESNVSSTFVPNPGGPKPRSWYVKLKATDKAKYDSAAVQTQMMQDAMALKEGFHDVAD
jgi:hypothetical protein